MRSWHRHQNQPGLPGSRNRRGLHAGWDSGGRAQQTVKKIQMFNMVSNHDGKAVVPRLAEDQGPFHLGTPQCTCVWVTQGMGAPGDMSSMPA